MSETTEREWRISPHDSGYPCPSYRLNDPDGQFIAEVYPGLDYQVVLTIKPHTQYEWYILNQRVITLVETARISERIDGRPSPDAQCHVCGRVSEKSGYGFPCFDDGCRGTMFKPGTFPNPKETP